MTLSLKPYFVTKVHAPVNMMKEFPMKSVTHIVVRAIKHETPHRKHIADLTVTEAKNDPYPMDGTP